MGTPNRQKVSRHLRLKTNLGPLLTAMALFVSAAVHAGPSPYFSAACHKSIATEVYAKENFDSFPCDISTIKDPTRIWVIGETHQRALLDPTITPDEATALAKVSKFWDTIRAGAAEGKVFLANEGDAVAMDGMPIRSDFYVRRIEAGDVEFGVEDGFAYVSGAFVSIYISLKGAMLETLSLPQSQQEAALKQLRYFVSWMLDIIWYNPYAQKAWQEVERPLANPDQEKFAKVIDQLACDPNGHEKLNSLVEQANRNDLVGIEQLIDLTAVKFANLLRTIKINQLQIPLEWYSDVISKISTDALADNGSNWQTKNGEIGISWRNALMASNIAKAYCADLQSGKNLPIVVRVGNKHVEDLLKHLKAMATKSRIKFEIIKTRQPILSKDEGG